MSAKFNIQDKHWLVANSKEKKLAANDKEVIFQTFESETFYDTVQIQNDLMEEKYYRKLSLISLILYPLEAILYLLLFGLKASKTHLKIFTLNFKLFCKRITFLQFKEQLTKIHKSVTI